MKEPSFHQMLMEKLQGPASHASGLDHGKALPLAFDSEPPPFFVEFKPVRRAKRWSVAKPAVKIKAEVPPPAPPPEIAISKADLGALEQGILIRFEKNFMCALGEKISKRQVLSVFRAFLKNNHPDLTGRAAVHDFAALVEIKDELIAAIEKPTRKS